jgi:EAL domain-containing protein (putative c-di-GMP-specific phosphodiesterase class I)/DNA-binding response OmpR family regulator
VPNLIQSLQQGFESRSVLIIDDDPTLAESLSRIFRMFFKECVTAVDGEEGFELFISRFNSSSPFTLVITDLELPKRGGLGLIKEIRSLSKTQPILIISAHDESEFMAEAIAMDVQGYLLKPLAMPKLFESLQKIFALVSKTNQIETVEIDKITGWQTLRELESKLQQLKDENVTLLRIRVNHLANIYSLVGEDFADEYLTELARMLESLILDSRGTFYRCSPDEFTLLLEGEQIPYATALGNDMVSVARYFHTSERGIILNSTLSVGIAYGNENVLLHSELALDKINDSLGEEVAYYVQSDEERQNTITSGQETLRMIFDALENENIVPFFQSIVNIKTGVSEMYESFIRIRKEEEIYGPEAFLNIAINTHQMMMITRSMIRNTFDFCRDLAKDSIVIIHLSYDDLNDNGLLPYINFWTERYNLSPENIAFEIGGGMHPISTKSPFAIIKKLKMQGYKIVINNFGSEQYDLSTLFSLKPDYIKLHHDLTQRVEAEPDLIAIIQKLVDIIHLLGAQAIAKHISSPTMMQLLVSTQIDYMQGYAIGTPFEVIRDK